MAVDVKLNTKKNNKGSLAVVYARYSSHSQGEQSIEGQLSEAKKFAEAHGYTIVHEYIDRAKTGRTDNREAFQQMLTDTAKHQFDTIITWKIDRFGRNREEIAFNKYRCKKNGVRIVRVAESVPDGPEGVILDSVLEGMAEYYSLQLAQNIKRGIAESAEKCQSTGGNRPLGYKTGKDKKFEIDESTAPTVRMIFSMYASGSTVSEIVKRMNELGLRTLRGGKFTNNSLHSILKNEKYIGIYNNHGKHTEGGVPRIVEDDIFYKVQEMLKINKRAPAKTWARADYLLADKAFCGHCGAPMFGESGTSKTGARHNYYICSNKKRFKTCKKKAVRQADLEGAVLNAISELLNDFEILDEIIDRVWACYQEQDTSNEEIGNLQRRLDQIEQGIKNLIRAIEAGILTDETKARMDELTAQKQELNAAIADREIARSYHLRKEDIACYIYGLRDTDYTNITVQKRLIQTFVNSVFVYDDGVKIGLNITGERSTVVMSLQKLNDAESKGGEFGRYALCSTKRKRQFPSGVVVFFCSIHFLSRYSLLTYW